MSDKEFPEGLIFKAPRDGAPDYVIGSISIKIDEFQGYLDTREGEWLNLNLKRGQSGKYYAEVDNWKPQAKAPPPSRPGRDVPQRPQQGRPVQQAPRRQSQDFDDSVPF